MIKWKRLFLLIFFFPTLVLISPNCKHKSGSLGSVLQNMGYSCATVFVISTQIDFQHTWWLLVTLNPYLWVRGSRIPPWFLWSWMRKLPEITWSFLSIVKCSAENGKSAQKLLWSLRPHHSPDQHRDTQNLCPISWTLCSWQCLSHKAETCSNRAMPACMNNYMLLWVSFLQSLVISEQ